MAHKTTKRVPYWIIVNWNRNPPAIWQKTYLTYDSAKRELDMQALKFPNHGCVIEQKEYLVDSEDVVGGIGNEFSNF